MAISEWTGIFHFEIQPTFIARTAGSLWLLFTTGKLGGRLNPQRPIF